MASNNIKDEKKIIFYFNHKITDKFTVVEDKVHIEGEEDPDHVENEEEVDQEEKEAEKHHEHKIVTTSENIFLPGEVVARIISPGDPRYNETNKFNFEYLRSDFAMRDTLNVMYKENTGEFVSVIYGFAKLKDNIQIVVEPLIEYTKNFMKAWVYVCKTNSRNWPTFKHIKSLYEVEKIVFPLEDSQVQPFFKNIVDHGKSGKKILIAEGTPPVPGRPEMIELRKEMTLKIGKMDETGRIDYKEKDSFIVVNEDEVIAEVLPMIPPENGVNVRGEETIAKIEGENPYRIGQNVRKDPDNPSLIVAASDGVLEIDEDGKIHVENKLTIHGNVNLETGNVHFPGTVEIKGTVETGFLVEADGNVLVHDNVEDAKIVSGGNIIVLNGVIGKEEVFLEAKGTINCKFTQNARMKSGNEIKIKESAIQTKAFAKDSIHVAGAVIGGELIARRGLIVDTAGSHSGVKTHLIAGRDPEVEEELDKLNHINTDLGKKLKDIIDELTQLFGEDFATKIKTILPSLPKHRKISALKLIKEMQEVNGKLTKVKAEKEKLKNLLTFDEPPFIKIINQTYPEVYIKIKTSIKKIEKSIVGKATFKEDPVEKVIYWDGL